MAQTQAQTQEHNVNRVFLPRQFLGNSNRSDYWLWEGVI